MEFRPEECAETPNDTTVRRDPDSNRLSGAPLSAQGHEIVGEGRQILRLELAGGMINDLGH